LDPGEHKVDVRRCRQFDMLVVGVYPCIHKPGRGVLGQCRLRRTGSIWMLTDHPQSWWDSCWRCTVLQWHHRRNSHCCRSRTLDPIIRSGTLYHAVISCAYYSPQPTP
jgi:hypothetical protein